MRLISRVWNEQFSLDLMHSGTFTFLSSTNLHYLTKWSWRRMEDRGTFPL